MRGSTIVILEDIILLIKERPSSHGRWLTPCNTRTCWLEYCTCSSRQVGSKDANWAEYTCIMGIRKHPGSPQHRKCPMEACEKSRGSVYTSSVLVKGIRGESSEDVHDALVMMRGDTSLFSGLLLSPLRNWRGAEEWIVKSLRRHGKISSAVHGQSVLTPVATRYFHCEFFWWGFQDELVAEHAHEHYERL